MSLRNSILKRNPNPGIPLRLTFPKRNSHDKISSFSLTNFEPEALGGESGFLMDESSAAPGPNLNVLNCYKSLLLSQFFKFSLPHLRDRKTFFFPLPFFLLLNFGSRTKIKEGRNLGRQRQKSHNFLFYI